MCEKILTLIENVVRLFLEFQQNCIFAILTKIVFSTKL